MGDTSSTLQKTSYPETLTFVETNQDLHFGPTDIYRTKDPPYEYVMDYQKNFVEDCQRTTKYQRLMNQLKHMQHKNIAKIHHCQLIQETQVCIKHKKLHTYCNYYNFTLESAVQKKKLMGSCFPESQLVYIMGCLVDGAQYLQKYGLSVGQYRAGNIFLSPEGFVKVFLLQIQEENRHNCYYKALSDRSLIDELIFAPEQLYYLNNMEYQLRFDVYKADLFAIGMVILELMTLDKSKFYYNQEKTELKIDRISFDISSLHQHYSEAFINLLKGCLQPDPQHRLTLSKANQELSVIRKGMKSVTYCIRLQQDDQKAKKGAKRQITMSVKGQHILNGLHKKLTPSPISTFSSFNSSVSSQYQIDSRRNSNRSYETDMTHQ